MHITLLFYITVMTFVILNQLTSGFILSNHSENVIELYNISFILLAHLRDEVSQGELLRSLCVSPLTFALKAYSYKTSYPIPLKLHRNGPWTILYQNY